MRDPKTHGASENRRTGAFSGLRSTRLARRVRVAIRNVRRVLPDSLYGRAALILIVPITAVQLVVSVSFVQRVYEDVTEQMTQNIVVEIDLLLDNYQHGDNLIHDANLLRIGTEVGNGPLVDRVSYFDISGATIVKTLRDGFPDLIAVDLMTNPRMVHLSLKAPPGVLQLSFPRRRVTAANRHQLLVLIFFTSVLVTFVAYLFLRNQLRPIRKLAQAAEAFGRGHHREYSPGGSSEVRSAGETFLNMRARIEQHREQRTMMLSGVSHDLRTPLTRLRLALALSDDSDDTRDMLTDLDEMERLIDSFLDFAGSEATEQAEPTNLTTMVQGIVEKATRSGAAVSIGALPTDAPVMVIRKFAIERALDNLVGNALRYGNRAVISLQVLKTKIRFTVEDDGPGIPPELHQEALKPFSRLDPSRNQNKGGGVGLGLPIALDVALSHGGNLFLEESAEFGGLCAVIELPLAADSASQNRT
ncbi:MAG: two-component system osmolarity sensor histidine kinase EnvZ [Paracoccaceae bacterium]|jgi:two-component system osmolarity sensor histidine kinase EnvZ